VKCVSQVLEECVKSCGHKSASAGELLGAVFRAGAAVSGGDAEPTIDDVCVSLPSTPVFIVFF
jgi:hypothetical protein